MRPFPNPFRPAQGRLTFAFLPPQAQVYIFALSGRLVQTLSEEDRDGGVQWDGQNQAGEGVASGVYFFRAVHGGKSRSGKFALVRE